MCNEDYFVMYPLFNLEHAKGFKFRSNMGMFSGAGDSMGKFILNFVKFFNLRERKYVVKRIKRRE